LLIQVGTSSQVPRFIYYFLREVAYFRYSNVALLPCRIRKSTLLNDFDEADL
jgi:hypothetical protein